MVSRVMVRVVQGVLVVGMALSLLAQVWALPVLAAQCAAEFPEVAYLRWPALALCVVGVGCLEVVMVSTWRLLGAVQADRIFSDTAFPWVDAIVWALGVAAVLAGVVLLWSVISGLGPLSLPVGALVGMLTAVGLAALMVVMRALLHQAAGFSAELEDVI